MAEAYECDRCGALREGSPARSLTVADGYGRGRPQDAKRVLHDREIPSPNDLCTACHNDLRRWYRDGGGDASDVTIGPAGEEEQ